MQTLKITVQNENGLHTRPGTVFVKACKKFESKITLSKHDVTVNAKSLMKLMSAGVVKGDVITLTIEGNDEVAAAEQLQQVVTTLEG